MTTTKGSEKDFRPKLILPLPSAVAEGRERFLASMLRRGTRWLKSRREPMTIVHLEAPNQEFADVLKAQVSLDLQIRGGDLAKLGRTRKRLGLCLVGASLATVAVDGMINSDSTLSDLVFAARTVGMALGWYVYLRGREIVRRSNSLLNAKFIDGNRESSQKN